MLETNRQNYDHVTAIIYWPIEQWYVDWIASKGKAKCNQESKHARKIGTRVDDLIMRECEGTPIKFKKTDGSEVRSCVDGWKLWKERYQPEVLDWQVTEYDDVLGVVGTRDLRARIGGNYYLIDLKCASKVTYQYAVQIAKYADMTKEQVDYEGVLRLDKLCHTYEWVNSSQNTWPWKSQQCVEAFEGLTKWYRLAKQKGEAI